MTAPQKRERIGVMAEPVSDDMARALIVTAYQARETLALVAREPIGDMLDSDDVLDEAESYLRAVGAYLLTDVVHDALDDDGIVRLQAMGKRAIRATESARSLCAVARSYPERGGSDFEKKQRKRAERRCEMATEAARQEAHRLLAELAEVFPNAYHVDEELIALRSGRA